ncbi:MAG: Gfo/Idh/MocA family oxidoreductase [Pirellulaceae bacterium]|jgi:predicted dehydrogenase|nr:Gfo/Idh/MocA family oxidoreductase [Pirellulaceae bacterium]
MPVPSVRLTRRTLIQSAAAATLVGPAILSRPARGQAAPSERIRLGFIGVGTMGRGHVGRFLGHDDVQVVAISDVVAERADHARQQVESKYAEAVKSGKYQGCAVHNDFRELLAREDVDAVVIATPDHWHALGCVAAARAKKDIYCEKPLTHTIAQGKKIIAAVREHKIVFQTGSQQRSEFGGLFRQAVDYVRNGRIGKLKTVRVGVGGPPVPCDLPDEETPAGTDWNLWLGPAPERGYNEILCPRGVHKHFPAWRNYREYAGGGLADMGAHHFDIAQWAMKTDGSGPVEILPPPGQATSGLKMIYASGIELFHGGRSGCTFEGTDGTLYVDRGKIESMPASILETPLAEGDERVELSTDHARNWLDAIRTRQDPICTAEIGASSAAICHLANIGYALRRPLKWNPEKQEFPTDSEANKLLDYEMRGEWKL